MVQCYLDAGISATDCPYTPSSRTRYHLEGHKKNFLLLTSHLLYVHRQINQISQTVIANSKQTPDPANTYIVPEQVWNWAKPRLIKLTEQIESVIKPMHKMLMEGGINKILNRDMTTQRAIPNVSKISERLTSFQNSITAVLQGAQAIHACPRTSIIPDPERFISTQTKGFTALWRHGVVINILALAQSITPQQASYISNDLCTKFRTKADASGKITVWGINRHQMRHYLSAYTTQQNVDKLYEERIAQPR